MKTPRRIKETQELIGETAPVALTTGFWIVSSIAAVAVVSVGVYWFVTPATVSIQNTVFHQSQPYTDGMARDLDNLRLAYITADTSGKDTIRATIQHRFAGYDASRLPSDLQNFLSTIQR